jgi:hypothetical protein
VYASGGAQRRRPSLAELDAWHEGAHPRDALLAAAREVLEHTDSPGARWRYGRALHQVAMDPGTSAGDRRRLLGLAYEEITGAKADLPPEQVKERCAAFRWSGIVLSDLSSLQGTTESIKSAYAIRADFETAMELDPTEPSAYHLMGVWCMEVAKVTGWTRWLASSLYAEPPSSSVAEAGEFFSRAEELAPGFWSANQVMLATVALEQGDREGARYWARCAKDLPVKTANDKASHAAALAILSKLEALG